MTMTLSGELFNACCAPVTTKTLSLLFSIPRDRRACAKGLSCARCADYRNERAGVARAIGDDRLAHCHYFHHCLSAYSPTSAPRALTIYLPKPCEANTRLKHFETAMRRSTKSTWPLQLPTRYKPSYKSTQQRYVVFVPMHKCAG